MVILTFSGIQPSIYSGFVHHSEVAYQERCHLHQRTSLAHSVTSLAHEYSLNCRQHWPELPLSRVGRARKSDFVDWLQGECAEQRLHVSIVCELCRKIDIGSRLVPVIGAHIRSAKMNELDHSPNIHDTQALTSADAFDQTPLATDRTPAQMTGRNAWDSNSRSLSRVSSSGSIRHRIDVGSRVHVAEGNLKGACGTVMFVGGVHFASGVWVGLKLDAAGRPWCSYSRAICKTKCRTLHSWWKLSFDSKKAELLISIRTLQSESTTGASVVSVTSNALRTLAFS